MTKKFLHVYNLLLFSIYTNFHSKQKYKFIFKIMFKYFHEKYYSSRKDLYWHQIKIYMKGKYYIEIRHFVQIIQKFFFKIMFKYFCKIPKKKIYIVYKLNKICMKSSNPFFHFIRLKIISGLKFAYWKKQHENVLYRSSNSNCDYL